MGLRGSDPSGFLPLSRCQEAQFGQWLRPDEFVEQPTLLDDVGGQGAMYLVQDVITDCSVVASLSAAAAWEHAHSSQVSPPKPRETSDHPLIVDRDQ